MRGEDVAKRPVDPAELTRIYTDEAIAFVERNREQPFFLYLPHTMLHVPLGVSPEFRRTSNLGLYGDAIQELDHHVGRLLDALGKLPSDRRTLVIYASDNGRGPGRNEAQPLRGRKLSTFEAGIRVPCIAWGPGLGIRRGYESDTLVHAMDWYPTLASLAGIEVPQGRVIDGRDISPLLLGQTDDVPLPEKKLSLNATVPLRRPWNPGFEWREIVSRDEYTNAFFYHGSHGALAAVRSGRWKLCLNPSLALYDLESDPGESKPIRNQKVARQLRGMAVLFQEEMRDGSRRVGQGDP